MKFLENILLSSAKEENGAALFETLAGHIAELVGVNGTSSTISPVGDNFWVFVVSTSPHEAHTSVGKRQHQH